MMASRGHGRRAGRAIKRQGGSIQALIREHAAAARRQIAAEVGNDAERGMEERINPRMAEDPGPDSAA
jgi:hypothetical protein